MVVTQTRRLFYLAVFALSEYERNLVFLLLKFAKLHYSPPQGCLRLQLLVGTHLSLKRFNTAMHRCIRKIFHRKNKTLRPLASLSFWLFAIALFSNGFVPFVSTFNHRCRRAVVGHVIMNTERRSWTSHPLLCLRIIAINLRWGNYPPERWLDNAQQVMERWVKRQTYHALYGCNWWSFKLNMIKFVLPI